MKKKSKPKKHRYPKVILPQNFKHTKRTRSLAFTKLRVLRFVPCAVILSVSLGISQLNPDTRSGTAQLSQGVMSYAVGVSSNGMLAQTNLHRSQNSLAAVALNSKLNQAAQAK